MKVWLFCEVGPILLTFVKMWWSISKRGDLAEAAFVLFHHHDNSQCSPCSFIYILCTIRLMPTFNRQNPCLLKDMFQEIITKTTKNMANIDHYHGDEMRHMKLPQDHPFQCDAFQQNREQVVQIYFETWTIKFGIGVKSKPSVDFEIFFFFTYINMFSFTSV